MRAVYHSWVPTYTRRQILIGMDAECANLLSDIQLARSAAYLGWWIATAIAKVRSHTTRWTPALFA